MILPKYKQDQWKWIPGILLLLVAQMPFVTCAAMPPQKDCVLLLQRTPINGGTVTPSVDEAHYYETNTTVKLVAIAKAGFHFVYWLGDVSEPTANNTTVTLDTPKYIIAVFSKDKFGFVSKIGIPQSAGGPANLLPYTPLSSPGSVSPSSSPSSPSSPNLPVLVIEEEPIIVPEPAASAILVLGAIYLLRKKNTMMRQKADLPKTISNQNRCHEGSG
ncbi:MAG: hypothetical protein ABIG61_06560 [Planctomycetota bacterium]